MITWRLINYVNSTGKLPVQEFLDALQIGDPDRHAYFYDVLERLLKDHGPGLGMPHFKRLPPTSFCEIRWNGADHAHYRIYCSIEKDRRLVLFHAVAKRWQKFDSDDKAICNERYSDYHSGDYDWRSRLNKRTGADS
jgi:hypothetical protein